MGGVYSNYYYFLLTYITQQEIMGKAKRCLSPHCDEKNTKDVLKT